MMKNETGVRVHILVKGRVQGVGFRAYVAVSAEQIGVKGWVRNVNWDRVETIAEGSREQVDKFIQAVRVGPRASRVEDCRVDEESYIGEFSSFEIHSSR